MKLAEIRNNEGHLILTEVLNRYVKKEYVVEYKIKSHKGEGWKIYTYKSIESAMKKYKKVANEMAMNYIAIC